MQTKSVEARRDYGRRNLEILPGHTDTGVRKAKTHLEFRRTVDIEGNMKSFYTGTLVVKG